MTVITAELVERFTTYYREHPWNWGSLHVVLDDQNFEDDVVEHVIVWTEGHDDIEGAALGRILLTLTEEQRENLGQRAEAAL